MKILVVLCIFLIYLLNAKEEYELGNGAQVGELPLYLGGYFSLGYSKSDDMSQYSVDDIAVLGYGSYEEFSYLVEFEFKDFYVQTEATSGLSKIKKDYEPYAERAYIDYTINESYELTLGKFNTPIGFWNMLPINVLRETTSNPMIVSTIFPRFTTGADLEYSDYVDAELKLDIILQNNNDLDSQYNNYKIDKHYGLGISYEKDNYTLKINSGFFHKINDILNYNQYLYMLVSAKYDVDDYQFLVEAGSQKSKSKFTTEYAAYAQGLYRFTKRHMGVVRLESYDDKISGVHDEIFISGYTYRPQYPIALKGEYQFHSQSKLNQFLCSFSILF